jgi:hypothetical protein
MPEEACDRITFILKDPQTSSIWLMPSFVKFARILGFSILQLYVCVLFVNTEASMKIYESVYNSAPNVSRAFGAFFFFVVLIISKIKIAIIPHAIET